MIGFGSCGSVFRAFAEPPWNTPTVLQTDRIESTEHGIDLGPLATLLPGVVDVRSSIYVHHDHDSTPRE